MISFISIQWSVSDRTVTTKSYHVLCLHVCHNDPRVTFALLYMDTGPANSHDHKHWQIALTSSLKATFLLVHAALKTFVCIIGPYMVYDQNLDKNILYHISIKPIKI